MIEILQLIPVGILAGVLGYLLGIGGGVLIVPVLVLIFGYPIHTAVAASLASITVGSVLISASNLNRNFVNVPLAVTLETVTILGALIGGYISVSVSERPILIMFSIVTLITAYLMWKKTVSTEDAETPPDEGNGFYSGSYMDELRGRVIHYKVKKVHYSMLVSAGAGVISSMLGVGGGFFKVPAMNILSGVPLRVATATSNFMIGFTAAAGCVAYIFHGYMLPQLAGSIIAGVLIGSTFATAKLRKVTDSRIKKLFIFILLLIALQMFIRSLG
ncbi:sulfite exporter TauE/SafE family protein [Geovibrio sp. ADMFC3]